MAANTLFLGTILFPVLAFMGISVCADVPDIDPIRNDTVWVHPLFNREYLDEYDFLKPPPLYIQRKADTRTFLQIAAAGTVTDTHIVQGDSTYASFCCRGDFYDITDLKPGTYLYQFSACHIGGELQIVIDK